MNNIIIRIQLLMLAVAFFYTSACAQSGNSLKVISTVTGYKEQIRADSNRKLIDLKRNIPSLLFDLRYCTSQNFTQQRLYPEKLTTTYLCGPAALALKAVCAAAADSGWQVKIFDAYRPYAVTQLMWFVVPDERYAANPAKGSGHNRGIAVDLTLVDRRTGKDLDMGTGFDNFSDTAHHDFRQLPDAVLANRLRLRRLMESHGFKALETEWWHYSWPNDGRFEVLDLSFRQVNKLSRLQ